MAVKGNEEVKVQGKVIVDEELVRHSSHLRQDGDRFCSNHLPPPDSQSSALPIGLCRDRLPVPPPRGCGERLLPPRGTATGLRPR